MPVGAGPCNRQYGDPLVAPTNLAGTEKGSESIQTRAVRDERDTPI